MNRRPSIEATIAADLANGPAWARSFQAACLKSALNRMVDDGLVERVKPIGGRSRNMVALTEAGRERYCSRVPA